MMAGSSFAGSPFATLPPMVPRLRTSGSAISGTASARTPNFDLMSSERSSVAWRVPAPMRTAPSSSLMYSSPAMRLMSTRWPNEPRRSLSVGSRLMPPESTFASAP